MGLDTSHDCWHGPYSAFMSWRSFINYCVMTERGKTDDACKQIGFMGTTHEAYMRALDEGMYDDQSVPINVLMAHSDCDGSIAAKDCAPLADALEALMPTYMPPRAYYDIARPATERFIAGLRKAAAKKQKVTFA